MLMRICEVCENRCRELDTSGISLNKTAPTFVKGNPVTFQVKNALLKSIVQGMT
jgi:hypothetical protein